MNPNDLFDLWQVARSVIWRYELDKMETAALRSSMRTVHQSANEIFAQGSRKLTRWQTLRNAEVVTELRNLSVGIREQVTNEISNSAAIAGAEATEFHSDTLSVGGRSPHVNPVALSPAQFKSFFQDTPLGGKTLGQWVENSFERNVLEQVKRNLDSGVLQGKPYRELVSSIQPLMNDFSRKGALLIARSYVQSANVLAQQAVMEENRDVVPKWKWSAVLEMGSMETGNGTCLACASLDGREFNHGEGPDIPLHPNCRCFPISVTVSFKELGVNKDELEDVARPWTEREDVPIGEGGRNIIDYGHHKGNYDTWFETRGEKFQKTVLGPKRYELYKDGKLKFDQLVDPNTGRVYRLNELPGGVGPGDAGPGITPTPPVTTGPQPKGMDWDDPDITDSQMTGGGENQYASGSYWNYDTGENVEHGQAVDRKRRVERKLQERLKDDPDWNYFKTEGAEELVGHYSGMPFSPEAAVIQQWASSSSSKTSIYFQKAARKEFNMRDTITTHFAEETITALENSIETLQKKGVSTNRLELGARKFMRAMYEQTQADFKAQGITSVTAYRGMNLETSTMVAIKNDLKGRTKVAGVGRANMKFQPLNSWSQNIDTAKLFTYGSDGAILASKIPVEDIIGSALSGYGCLKETEYVVMGGSFNLLGLFGVGGTRGPEVARKLQEFLTWERSIKK